MQKRKIFIYFFFFIVLVASGIAKNRLCKPGFLKSIPTFIASIFSLLGSTLMTKKYKLPDRFQFAMVALLILYGVLIWNCNEKVKSFVIGICAPSKIIFTCILTKIFVGLKFKTSQSIGLLLILIGILLSQVNLYDEKSTNISVFHIILCIFNGFIFSTLNLSFEIYQNKFQTSFWELCFTCSLISVPISFSVCVFELLRKNLRPKDIFLQENLFYIFIADYIELAVKISMLYSISPIYRSTLVLLLSLTIGIVDCMIFDTQNLSFINISSLLIANLGLVVFDYEQVKKILLSEKDVMDNIVKLT